MTTAVEPEEAVVAPAAEDAVQALGAADRRGLLTYHGYVSGGRYEVTVTGHDMILTAADAVPLVQRLRAVDALGGKGLQVTLSLSGEATAADAFLIGVSGQPFEVPAANVIDWCAGFQAALDGGPGPNVEHHGDDNLAQIAELMEQPTLDDQCRIVILGLQHGPSYVSTDEIRRRIGELPGVVKPPAKKTLLDALAFGNYLSRDLREKLIAAFGYRWTMGGERPAEPIDGDRRGEALPQMPSLAALRRIVAAAQAGWVRYVDEPAPNRARRLASFRLAIGSDVYDLRVTQIGAWLDGVAAYHHMLSRR